MEESAQQMHSYYAARASYYDDVYLKPERQADIAFLREFLGRSLAGRHVLELACGTGYWSQHIAPHAASYLATDGLAEPLEFAKQRPGIVPARCLVADVYHLPASLGQFDGAFAGLWFSHVPIERRDEFFASLHARLQPGARVVLLDNSMVQCQDFPITETDAQGNTYQMRPLKDGSQHRVLKNFPREEELRQLGLSFGAQQMEYRLLDNFWYFLYTLPVIG